MKKRLILPLTSLFLILSSLVILGITYGWFADLIDLDSGVISVGDLRYFQNGDFITDDTIIYPGLELVDTEFDVTNTSPIESQLRIQITYTRITNPGGAGLVFEENYIYTDASTEHISVVFDSTFVYDTEYWYLNGTTSTIAADSGLIELVSSIIYDGVNTNIDYVEQDVAVSITIEIKQNDNATWSELVGYDFSTGEPEI
ncbi:MAG: hypothetical protein JEZ05_03845 [Tenericutes bacterium]|nr:hypothetical protein [Mycoplasmatota bacterium]